MLRAICLCFAGPGLTLSCLVVLFGIARAETTESPILTHADDNLHLATVPQVLSDADTGRYIRLFALQDEGDWKTADRIMQELTDPVLMGHLLFQRYMHPTLWRSRYGDLKEWLSDYGDHPGANRIYKLAKQRQGTASAPSKPVPARGVYGAAPDTIARPPAPKRSKDERQMVEDFHKILKREVRRRNPDRAEKRYWAIESLDILAPHESADALGRVVFAYFMAGDDEKAVTLAAIASGLAPTFAHDANWYGGLAAWRLQDFKTAQILFTHLANALDADTWQRAAGGVWGARAALAQGQMSAVTELLLSAASENETFYGLIAARQLGLRHAHDWQIPALNATMLDDLLAIKAVRRAIALAQIGQSQLADEEIRLVAGRTKRDVWPALASLAAHLNLPTSQLRLAHALADDALPTRLHYPLPDWAPEDGFTVDRAVLFAIIRQESKFSSAARSYKGASGLMQIMPATASYITGDAALRWQKSRLLEPDFNMSVGQSYVTYLSKHPAVKGNLIKLAVAYNAGPGNLSRWERTVNYQDDPLLFMEALPSRETRSYVERVMANLWLYRIQLGQDAPGLDALAAGQWPVYVSLDGLNMAEQPSAEAKDMVHVGD